MAASVAKRKFAVQTVFYRLRTLTHFQPTFHFYTPRKYQKTYGYTISIVSTKPLKFLFFGKCFQYF